MHKSYLHTGNNRIKDPVLMRRMIDSTIADFHLTFYLLKEHGYSYYCISKIAIIANTVQLAQSALSNMKPITNSYEGIYRFYDIVVALVVALDGTIQILIRKDKQVTNFPFVDVYSIFDILAKQEPRICDVLITKMAKRLYRCHQNEKNKPEYEKE